LIDLERDGIVRARCRGVDCGEAVKDLIVALVERPVSRFRRLTRGNGKVAYAKRDDGWQRRRQNLHLMMRRGGGCRYATR
jgi:hypothetical protein